MTFSPNSNFKYKLSVKQTYVHKQKQRKTTYKQHTRQNKSKTHTQFISRNGANSEIYIRTTEAETKQKVKHA